MSRPRTEWRNGGIIYIDYDHRDVVFPYAGIQVVEWRCKRCSQSADTVDIIHHLAGCVAMRTEVE